MADNATTKPGLSSPGIEVKPAHFPGRAPVDTYGNGGFRFADMSHRGSILCLPSGIYGWSAQTPEDLTVANFARVLGESEIELILVGTGPDIAHLPESLTEALSNVGIRADAMNTGAAARTFNVLLAEGRAVGAALLAVD
ncbi:MAG: Mth938-like domain-containing protein [Pseudomonadota bacterium]